MTGDAGELPGRILIIGLGNEYRQDDGVGLYVARKLREKNLPQASIVEATGEAAALMELWQNAASVILVDAVRSGAEPGRVYRFDAGAEPLPARYFSGSSTHSLGLAEALELARVLNRLPPRLIVYGIQGKTFGAGRGLSPEVEQAGEKVVAQVLRDLGVREWS